VCGVLPLAQTDRGDNENPGQCELTGADFGPSNVRERQGVPNPHAPDDSISAALATGAVSDFLAFAGAIFVLSSEHQQSRCALETLFATKRLRAGCGNPLPKHG
jgi:hypothetical protein